MNDETLRFLKNFFWGAATSAHQVEGGQYNDWSEWERSPTRIGDLEKRGLLKKYGKDNYLSGQACDHYQRYAEDFALAKTLGHNATRFSIEWSRIEPKEGVFDEAALAHYQDVVRTARAQGLEPFVTLWHWTVPLWFRDQGGWTNPRAPEVFSRYVERVVSTLGTEIKFWITLNEPEIVAASYLAGRFPPQQRNLFSYFSAIRNLIKAHQRAYRVLKHAQPNMHVGIAHNVVDFEAAHHNPWNHLLKWLANWWVNDYFFDRIRNTQDFLGCNYYFHHRIDLWFNRNRNERVSDMGWELFPSGIERVLVRLKKYNKPIYITENGLADANDRNRSWFLTETLRHAHRAFEDGADVRGYFHWSLLDNFEWDSGYWPRFGLVAVDRATQKRTPRSSASVYQKLIGQSREV